MARKRKFKTPFMQEAYDNFLAADPPPETRGKGAAHNAYYVGRYHPDPKKPFGPRGTRSYAAWAAGIDNARKAAGR